MKKNILTALIIIYSLFPALAYGAQGQMFGAYDLMNSHGVWNDNSDEYGVGIFDNLFKKSKEDNYKSEEKINSSPTDPVFSGKTDVQSVLYNSILTPDPRLVPYMGTDDKKYGPRSVMHSTQNMPLFKKARIKLMNKIRRQEEKEYLKELENEKKQLTEYEKSLDEEAQDYNIFQKIRRNTKPKDVVDLNNKVKEIVIEDESNEKEISDVTEENQPKKIRLHGKLKEVQGENIIVLDADDIYYVEGDDEIVAENSAIVKFPRQKITVTADKFIYSNANNIIKAVGNVVISGKGHKLYSDYIQVNVNEEEISIDKIVADFNSVKMEAKGGVSRDNTLYLYDGFIQSDKPKTFNLKARRIKGIATEGLIPVEDEDKFYIQKSLIKDNSTKLFSDRVIINAKDDHDVITLKKSKLFYGKNKILNIPSLTAYTDKSHSVFEANYPEFGTISQLGTFAGPGFTFDIPHAGIVKVVPFLNYRKEKFGIGGALRYRSANNMTEIAYGSVSDIFVAKGIQYLDDNLTLRYGMNSFMEDWFLGPRRPKYVAELVNANNYTVQNSIKNGLNLNYSYLASLGYYHNSMYNINYENFGSNNFGTMRGRYMAQIQQDLFKYQNREKHTRFNLGALMQGSAAMYGNGDTQFIGRMGLSAASQYKYWVQNIAYFLSASQDHTPMERFDAYRYGSSSVMILEALRLCKFLSVAWSGMLTLSNDSPNGRMVQESSFMLVIGPDDLRVTLGYDWVRRMTYVTVGLALDTSNSKLQYNVLEIKNPDKFNDESEKLEELCPDFWLIPETSGSKPRYVKAQVISIDENDDRERTN